MELTDEELEHIERLARVQLSGAARAKLRDQLADIIDFVRRLQDVDTSGYEPKAYVGGFKPFMRDDTVGSCLPRDEVLAQSPKSENGYFKVPPVIETEETP